MDQGDPNAPIAEAKDHEEMKLQRMAARQTRYWNDQFDFDATVDQDLDSDTCFDWLVSSEDVISSGVLDSISHDAVIMVS
jgi:hypothetical protein